jgi:hypothetical protein
MIILISLAMICYVPYACFVIDTVTDKCNDSVLGLFISLFGIVMPIAVLGQILFSLGVLK